MRHQERLKLIELSRRGGCEELSVPVWRDGQAGAVHEDQPADALGMVNGHFLRDPSAHRPAAEVGSLKPHGVKEAHDKVSLIADGVTGIERLFGLAEAKQIGGIDAIAALFEIGCQVDKV